MQEAETQAAKESAAASDVSSGGGGRFWGGGLGDGQSCAECGRGG